MTDIVEQAARVLSENWRNMHTNESLGKQRMLAQALADAGLLREPVTTILEEFVVPCAKCNPDEGRCIPCRKEADTYYRAAINAINPNLAAKELARDSDSDAGGYVGRDLRELAARIKRHLLQHPEPARTVPTREEIVDALFTQNIKNLSQNHNAKQNWRALADAVLTLLAWQPTIDEVWLAATAEERIRSDNGTRVPLEALLDVNEAKAQALEEAAELTDNPHEDYWLRERAQQVRGTDV